MTRRIMLGLLVGTPLADLVPKQITAPKENTRMVEWLLKPATSLSPFGDTWEILGGLVNEAHRRGWTSIGQVHMGEAVAFPSRHPLVAIQQGLAPSPLPPRRKRSHATNLANYYLALLRSEDLLSGIRT